MKRVGHLMEKMMTEENFVLAESLLGKNKPDNRMARHISANADKYGKALFNKVQNGEFQWHPPKETVILESYKGKERHLKIPCLEDQAVQLAWLNIATPYILRRNYYFNCGSVPKAGQTRAVHVLQKWLKDPAMKYGASTDIRKFYESCPHRKIRKALCRIFKDREFVEFAMGFVASMSDTGVGIAIGYPVSHWLANLVLMELDHAIVRLYPDVKFTRYMDDIAMASTNKRHIRKALYFIKNGVERLRMALKRWSWFRIAKRGITFLSYRFFNGYTLLTKPLMVRIARRIRKAPQRICAHVAAGVISYLGILKHCNSFNFRMKCVYPYIKVRVCNNLISLFTLKRNGMEAVA